MAYPVSQAAALPASVAYPAASIPQRWTTGLCGCFEDCGTCCYGFWCTSCAYGSNHATRTGDGCCGQCCAYGCMTYLGCCCFIHSSERLALRARYNLEAQPCGDCCVTMLCGPCAICQEAREMKNRTAMGQPPHLQPTVVMVAPPAQQMVMMQPATLQQQQKE